MLAIDDAKYGKTTPTNGSDSLPARSLSRMPSAYSAGGHTSSPGGGQQQQQQHSPSAAVRPAPQLQALNRRTGGIVPPSLPTAFPSLRTCLAEVAGSVDECSTRGLRAR